MENKIKSKNKKYLIISTIIVIVLISSIGIYGLKKHSESKEKNSLEMYTVPSSEKVYVNGVIEPQKSEKIFLDATKGSLNELSVENGQVVKKDQLLFTYKNEAITEQVYGIKGQIDTAKLQIEQLQNQKEKARQKINSQKNLKVPSGEVPMPVVDESQLEEFDNQISSLQAQVNSLQEQINHLSEKEYSSVLSPIDGKIILNKDAKDPTMPYIIVETSNFYVRGKVSEKEQPKISKDKIANIIVLSTNKEVKGKISYVDNRPLSQEISVGAVQGASQDISYYGVNIALDSQENLTNGFHVQATVNLGDSTVKIPKTCIIEEDGKEYVFKNTDKKAKKQLVETEKINEDEVIIKSGLSENDVIVKNPTSEMKEGDVLE